MKPLPEEGESFTMPEVNPMRAASVSETTCVAAEILDMTFGCGSLVSQAYGDRERYENVRAQK